MPSITLPSSAPIEPPEDEFAASSIADPDSYDRTAAMIEAGAALSLAVRNGDAKTMLLAARLRAELTKLIGAAARKDQDEDDLPPAAEMSDADLDRVIDRLMARGGDRGR